MGRASPKLPETEKKPTDYPACELDDQDGLYQEETIAALSENFRVI